MSIELEPSSQLAFRRPLTEMIKETLVIRNTSRLPIAFKVKTTAPKRYCVRPNSGRVEPGQELEVQVQMQGMSEDPPADFKCKDKFLVQSVEITPDREHVVAAELWPLIEKEAKDQIREKKIRCTFLPALEKGAPSPVQDHESSAALSTPVSTPVQHEQPTPVTVPAPGSPVPARASLASSAQPAASDAQVLKRELENAQQTIHTLQSSVERLQKEASTLRQRKPESGSSSAPTMTAVHLKQPQGYPVTYLAGAALISFLFAYLFF